MVSFRWPCVRNASAFTYSISKQTYTLEILMKRTSNPHAEEQLAQLVTQFDHWRSARASRAERIPPTLWQQAVALTAILPRSRVAKYLRVSWSDLHKQCVAAHTPTTAQTSPALLHFVEMPIAPTRPSGPPGTEIEVHRADGTRLRMHARESQFPVVALVRTFLETL
jgi:hypothetical protein